MNNLLVLPSPTLTFVTSSTALEIFWSLNTHIIFCIFQLIANKLCLCHFLCEGSSFFFVIYSSFLQFLNCFSLWSIMFVRWFCFVSLILLVGLRVEVANAQFYRKVRNKLLPYWSIVVDPSGHGNFSTIQSAIDSVPSDNRYWVSIKVKAGIYR